MGRAARQRKRARQRAKQRKHGMVLTKRAPKNEKRWSKEVGYAVRKLNRVKCFKG